jgi:hypothetical protein
MFHGCGSSVVSVRLAGRLMPVVLLSSCHCVPAAAANGIDGALMSLQQHRWSIDVVAAAVTAASMEH